MKTLANLLPTKALIVNRLPLLLSLVASVSFAQNAAISISCGDCGVFQSIQVVFDGQDMGAHQPMRIVDVSPGEHEVKVIKWKSPFATEVLYTGIVNFPAGTELRAKATKGKFDIYGKGAYTPPAPVVLAESALDDSVTADRVSSAIASLAGSHALRPPVDIGSRIGIVELQPAVSRESN